MENVFKFKEKTLFVRGSNSNSWGSDVITSFPKSINKDKITVFEYREEGQNGADFEKEYDLKDISCFAVTHFWGGSLENSDTIGFVTDNFFSDPTTSEVIKFLTTELKLYRDFFPIIKNKKEGDIKEVYKLTEGEIPQLVVEGKVKNYKQLSELLKEKGLL